MAEAIIAKIEYYLVDFLGLTVPGIIFFCLLLLMPICLFDNPLPPELWGGFVNSIELLQNIIDNLPFETEFLLFISICYIVGHVIKVFSKYQYDFCTRIFDGIVTIIVNLAKSVGRAAGRSRYRCFRILNGRYRTKFIKVMQPYHGRIKIILAVGVINIIFGLVEFFAVVAGDIFKFRPLDYEPANENIRKDVSMLIHAKYDFLPPDWHSLYILSDSIIREENIKSLAPTYRAKYSFYRSLALVFLLNIIYLFILFTNAGKFISPSGWQLAQPLLLINAVFWLTFHKKYKEYWKLCGNDRLVSLLSFFDHKENAAEKNNPVS